MSYYAPPMPPITLPNDWCIGGQRRVDWGAGGDEGLDHWRLRLECITQHYKRVLMLGDSMGGTAALLLAPLATSVQVFCPQVRFIIVAAHGAV